MCETKEDVWQRDVHPEGQGGLGDTDRDLGAVCRTWLDMFLRGSVLKLVSSQSMHISCRRRSLTLCGPSQRQSELGRHERGWKNCSFFGLDQWWMDDLTRSPGGWFFVDQCGSMVGLNGGWFFGGFPEISLITAAFFDTNSGFSCPTFSARWLGWVWMNKKHSRRSSTLELFAWIITELFGALWAEKRVFWRWSTSLGKNESWFVRKICSRRKTGLQYPLVNV